MDVTGFFAYARERQSIFLQRGPWGGTAPFTNDRILQHYRFCNIFREDDKTTAWFRENVRDPNREATAIAWATIIFRWFNRIETGKVLLRRNLMFQWDEHRARKYLGELNPLVTGAYVIATPPGMSKLDGLIWCIDNVWEQRFELGEVLRGAETLEWAHEMLMRLPYIGSFMAYEIVTDLSRTDLLCKATDISTWAAAGPGAARGLGRVFYGGADHYNYSSKRHQYLMQLDMGVLLKESQKADNWPDYWPVWEMREVEHTLCEYDKYERARLGQGRPKQLFRGGG